jgi:Xaa-Pro aminopeptidase
MIRSTAQNTEDNGLLTKPLCNQLEIAAKLQLMRNALSETQATGIRLRGTDWFAWATAGGSNTVLLAAETGVAEVLVTEAEAWILSDEIEAQRLQDEQLPQQNHHNLEESYKIYINPWAEFCDRESFVREATKDGIILSDRPTQAEFPLPKSLITHKQVMSPGELERYRQVGQLASCAMTEVLSVAQPTWTESQLAGAGAQALWAKGLQPLLILAAGERRLPLYRNPLPSQEAIQRQAMLVFCARGYGLMISLTRFVCFGSLSAQDQKLHQTVADIEAVALQKSQLGTPLSDIYNSLAQAYEQQGFGGAIREHHQGGTAGYQVRELIATPAISDRLAANMVLAWNPSLSGAKIEDTFVLKPDNTLENLSFDAKFPHLEIAGKLRPVPWER